MPPINDDFANATVLSGASGTVSGTCISATADDPDVEQLFGDGNVWYVWTCPVSDEYQFTLTMADVLALITVYVNDTYTPAGFGELIPAVVAANPFTDTAVAAFGARAGAVYYFEIDRYDLGVLGAGGFTLAWAPVAVSSPPDAPSIEALPIVDPGTMLLASPTDSYPSDGVYEWQIWRSRITDSEALLATVPIGDKITDAIEVYAGTDFDNRDTSAAADYQAGKALYWDQTPGRWFYKVKAVNAAGASDFSNEVPLTDFTLSLPSWAIDYLTVNVHIVRNFAGGFVAGQDPNWFQLPGLTNPREEASWPHNEPINNVNDVFNGQPLTWLNWMLTSAAFGYSNTDTVTPFDWTVVHNFGEQYAFDVSTGRAANNTAHIAYSIDYVQANGSAPFATPAPYQLSWGPAARQAGIAWTQMRPSNIFVPRSSLSPDMTLVGGFHLDGSQAATNTISVPLTLPSPLTVNDCLLVYYVYTGTRTRWDTSDVPLVAVDAPTGLAPFLYEGSGMLDGSGNGHSQIGVVANSFAPTGISKGVNAFGVVDSTKVTAGQFLVVGFRHSLLSWARA